jgi:hypothetical protein
LNNYEQIVFLQHHPFNIGLRPTPIWGFTEDKIKKITNLYKKHLNTTKIFGMLGGHLHRNFNGTCFKEIQNMIQWETDGNLRGPRFSLIKTQNSKIISLKHFVL